MMQGYLACQKLVSKYVRLYVLMGIFVVKASQSFLSLKLYTEFRDAFTLGHT